MDFAVVIPTPRLILREFHRDDWRRVLEYQSTPAFAKFNGWERRTEADARTFVTRFIDWQKERPRFRYQLAAQLRGSGLMIGNCGIRGHRDLRDAEMGFELDQNFWGHGYATEAASAMLDFAFSTLRLTAVHAQCVTENFASARVMRRLGMRFERTEQAAIWMKDRWWDTDQFSVTAEAWFRSPAAKEIEPMPAVVRQAH